MGIRDWLLSYEEDDNHPVGVEVLSRDDIPEVSAEEVARHYHVIGVNQGVVLLSDLRDPGRLDTRELGSTGQTKYGNAVREDYNGALRGSLGFDKYDQMRRGDAAVRATLRLMKTPITSARWFMRPADGDKTKAGKKRAEWVWKALTCDQAGYWQTFIQELLLSLDYGFYPFEKVFVKDEEGMVRWKYFSPRHPRDLYEWKFDEHGQLTGAEWYKSPVDMDRVFIKYPTKLINFVFDSEGGSPEGVSVLRSAYKHWYYKENLYKIDAIQKERHGIGIPVIKLPMNFNPDDKTLAQEMGRNLRTNEKAHVVLPPNFEIMMLKLEGQPVNALESAKHHNDMIAMNILATFLTGQGDMNSEAQMNLFLRSLRYIAEYTAEVITYNAIAQVSYWNWGSDFEYPQLKVRRVGDTVDWRTLSFAIRNLVGAKIITPDDSLEEWFRDEMDLSQWDPSTSREVETPQAGTGGARVGMPRQTPASKSQQAQNPGSSRVGDDNSGG